MLKIVHMKVNGKEVELAVDERESLLTGSLSRLPVSISPVTVSFFSP